MAAISSEPFELEVKRKEDGSWHPCRVSLSDDRFDIIVHFESCAEKDIISDRDDALARLRYRSVPLQRGECSDVKEGECVLVEHKVQSRSLLFDAVIEKPYRVKHSNRVHCRCTFEITWLNPELRGKTMTVSSKSIMKLSKKSITSHSTLDAFLNSLNTTNSKEGSPSHSLLEETIWDLVEKIEETSKLTDKLKECAGDDPLKAKRDKLSGGVRSKAAQNPNTLRRSTRSQNKQEVEIKFNEHSEDRPLLSPLAACAALASYIHELSPKREISLFHLEKKNHVLPPLNKIKNNYKEHSLDATSIFVKSSGFIKENVSVVSNPTQNTGVESPVEARLSRSSASNRRGSTKKSQANDSPVFSTMGEITAQASNVSRGKLSSPTIMEHKINPVTDGKLNGRAITTRITRSTVEKAVLDSTAEVAQGSSKEKHNIPMTKRITRSAKEREASNPSIMLDLGKSKMTEGSQDKELEGKLSSPAVMVHLTNPVTDGKLNGRAITTRTSSVVQKEILYSAAEVAQGSPNEKQNGPMNSTRLTRSAKRREVSNPSIKQDIGKSKLTEASQDISVDDVTPETNESKKKKVTSSPVDADTVLTLDTKKRTRASIVVTKEGQDEISQCSGSFPAVKKKAISSKEPELRSSPRLRFLPPARST